MDVEEEFCFFAGFPRGGSVVVAGEPVEVFHLSERAANGVALALVKLREVADDELAGFDKLCEHCVPYIVSERHGAFLPTKLAPLTVPYLKLTMLSLYNSSRLLITTNAEAERPTLYKSLNTRMSMPPGTETPHMTVTVSDGGNGTPTITYRSETALQLAVEALEYTQGHWPAKTEEHEHVTELHQEASEALRDNREFNIPVDHNSDRRQVFLFALSLYSQWLRDAHNKEWETPHERPHERAATVDKLEGPFKAYQQKERERRQREAQKEIAELFDLAGE